MSICCGSCLAWARAQGSRARSPQTGLEQEIAVWRESGRRFEQSARVKSPLPGNRGRCGGRVRTRIKAVELEAGKMQQEAMYDLVRGGLLGRIGAVGSGMRRSPMSRPMRGLPCGFARLPSAGARCTCERILAR